MVRTRHRFFDAVGDLRVVPGERLNLALAATDPDGDRVTFSLRNSSRLPNGTLKADGTLSFSPGPGDIGTYQFELVASDGVASSVQPVNLQVEADPVTTTRVSGIVLDVNQMPLAGMQVEIGAVQGLTMTDGTFTLDLGSGPLVSDTIKIRGELFPGPLAYPFIAEKLPLVLEHDVFAGVNNVIDRPIYLPVLDIANGMTIDPAQDTTVTTAAIPGASVFVSAGTLMNQQGTPFTGVLSITKVPMERTPAALPKNILPDTIVTIQPGEMVFAAPAPLTLPNRAGLASGVILDLWSISPVTGEFEIVGKGRVSDDGSVIETIAGGIRNSSWHLFGLNGDLDNESQQCLCEATKAIGSEVGLFSGFYREEHSLPTYTSLGETRGVRLVYQSDRADPNPVVRFGVPVRSFNVGTIGRGIPQNLTATLDVETTEGFVNGALGGTHYWQMTGIPTSTERVGAGIQLDFSNIPSGAYTYSLTAGIQQSSANASMAATRTVESRVVSVNTVDSVFGAGWGLAGHQQIIENMDGSALLIYGSGQRQVFDAPVGSDDVYSPPSEDFSTLVKLDDGSFKRTMPDQTIYTFNQDGWLESVEDRLARTSVYEYGAGNRLERIVDPAGLVTLFEYDGDHVSLITDPANRNTQLHYDAAGNLTQVVDPDGTQRQWEYDIDRRLIREIDKRGNTETTRYDEFGLVESFERTDASSAQVTPAASLGLYSAAQTQTRETAPTVDTNFSNKAVFVDSRGNPEFTEMDSAGRLLSQSDSVGHIVSLVRGRGAMSVSRDGKPWRAWAPVGQATVH